MNPLTITDDDLRDLLQRTGMSPEEIEQHLANPDAVAYAKFVLDRVHAFVAAQLAQRLIEKLFDSDDEFAISLRRKLFQ